MDQQTIDICRQSALDYFAGNLDLRAKKFLDGVSEKHPHIDLSLVEYKDRLTKVKLGCPEHGQYEAVPHLVKNSPNACCPGCKLKLMRENRSNNKEAITNKTRSSCLEKYGVDWVTKSEDVIQKTDDTCLKKYGYVRVSGTSEWKEQQRMNIIKKSTEHLSEEKLLEYEDNNFLQSLSKNGNTLQDIADYFDLSWDIIQTRFQRSGLTPHRHAISKAEREISEFLTSNGIDHITNDRKQLDGMELDIFIPDLRIGIEYNGVFWHSNDRDRHQNKLNACIKNDIRLIQIWEDDYLNHRERVLKTLSYKLGVIKSNINARDCLIVNLDKNTYDEFLDKNHMQGANGLNSFRLGLNHPSLGLVAVMGFKKKPSNVNKYGNGSIYELTRFATNGVRGAFSKLLTNFKKLHQPDAIYSFADLEIVDANNNVYIKNGFIELDRIPPDYSYLTKTDIRVHKFNFRKEYFKKLGLEIEGKTEYQLADEAGIRRCWDSGKICYVLFL